MECIFSSNMEKWQSTVLSDISLLLLLNIYKSIVNVACESVTAEK